MASIGFSIAQTTTRTLADARADMMRARRAAESYAERWLRKANAMAAAETKTSKAKVATLASAETQGSIERIAATESAEAFNTARAKRIRSDDARTLLRVWDAQLDKRTCPICSKAEGTIVGASEPFPLGEPGAVHPFCRCSWTLLTAIERETLLDIRPVKTKAA